jgi:predicted nucleic acid-binding protein
VKAYIDSDVILDVLLGRKEFLSSSSQVINHCEMGKMEGCSTVLALANIFYILNRYHSARARKAIQALRELLTILPVTDLEIGKALTSAFKDFEDGVQNFTAEQHGCEFIITRNKKDFSRSQLQVLTPDEYLLQVGE